MQLIYDCTSTQIVEHVDSFKRHLPCYVFNLLLNKHTCVFHRYCAVIISFCSLFLLSSFFIYLFIHLVSFFILCLYVSVFLLASVNQSLFPGFGLQYVFNDLMNCFGRTSCCISFVWYTLFCTNMARLFWQT